MIPFLSEEGQKRHREYVEGLRRRLQFLYKSCEELGGFDIRRLRRVRGSRQELAREVIALRADIMLHEVYFSSFSKREYPPSPTAAVCFGSAFGLLNEIKRAALSKGITYAGVCRRKGELRVFALGSVEEIFSLGEPSLVIDMAEHAYFFEFGFNREEYLGRALTYLNLSLLDENN